MSGEVRWSYPVTGRKAHATIYAHDPRGYSLIPALCGSYVRKAATALESDGVPRCERCLRILERQVATDDGH